MKVAFCASEVVPFVKTGGLADVCGTLPIALEKLEAAHKKFCHVGIYFFAPYLTLQQFCRLVVLQYCHNRPAGAF